jgi:hypothetical protein
MYKFSIALAWASLACGVLAILALIGGYNASFQLPVTPRPNTGPGFSESATAMFGGAFLGWWLACLGSLLGLASLALGKRRLFKLILAAPSWVYCVAPFFLVR